MSGGVRVTWPTPRQNRCRASGNTVHGERHGFGRFRQAKLRPGLDVGVDHGLHRFRLGDQIVDRPDRREQIGDRRIAGGRGADDAGGRGAIAVAELRILRRLGDRVKIAGAGENHDVTAFRPEIFANDGIQPMREQRIALAFVVTHPEQNAVDFPGDDRGGDLPVALAHAPPRFRHSAGTVSRASMYMEMGSR